MATTLQVAQIDWSIPHNGRAFYERHREQFNWPKWDTKDYDEKKALGEAYQHVMDKVYGGHHQVAMGFYNTKKEQVEVGECEAETEVKLDRRWPEFSRLYIETHEKKKDAVNWVKSGIYRADNSRRLLIGNPNIFWEFDKRWLQKARRWEEQGGGWVFKRFKNHTSRAFYIPIDVADKYCVDKFEPMLGEHYHMQFYVPPGAK